MHIVYCITGKFRDMKISRIWTLGNFATGKFTNFGIDEVLVVKGKDPYFTMVILACRKILRISRYSRTKYRFETSRIA